MIVAQRVHSREGIVKGLAHIPAGTVEALRKPRLGLGVGLLVAALAGAPMPLPELAIVGPWIAYLAAGRKGAWASAAAGFSSFAFFAHPSPVAIAFAALFSALAAYGVPTAMASLEERANERRRDDGGASAITIDCDGFASLDESYGEGSGDHVFSMLRRALEQETRDTDLVVHVQGQELVLVLDGASPEVAQSVMMRVERRFSQWISDAGYECNLSVGVAGYDEDEVEFDRIMRSARRAEGPYLD